jgi:hypothetical protein
MHRQLLVVALCVGCGDVASPTSDGGPTSDGPVANADVLGGTLRNGCVLALHMDEAAWTGAAGEVKDDCGNDNAGTLSGTGTTTVAHGAHGRAGNFTGDGCIDIANAAALHGTTGLTLSAWMFPTMLDGGNNNANGLISKRNDANDQPEYSLSVWTGFRVYVDLDTPNDRFASPAVISTNTWTQVTLVYDGTLPLAKRAQLYISGRLDATQPETSASLTPYTSALHIGCTPAPSASPPTQQGFIGQLDEVAIWNRPLTEDEVAQWYVNTKPAS